MHARRGARNYAKASGKHTVRRPITASARRVQTSFLVAMPAMLMMALIPSYWRHFTGQAAGLVAMATAIGIVGASYVAGKLYYKAAGVPVNVFYPLGFPLAYLAFSFVAPPAYAVIRHTNLGTIRPDESGEVATWLMVWCVAAAATGAALALGLPKPPAPNRTPRIIDGRRLVVFGRLSMIVLILTGLYGIAQGGVLARGLGQGQYSTADAVAALSVIFTPVAPVLCLLGHRVMGRRTMLRITDWLLIAGVLAVFSLNGNRGSSVGMIVLLAMWGARYGARRAAPLRLATLLVITLTLALGVLRYRTSIQGDAFIRNKTRTEIVLGDLNVAAETTMGTQRSLDTGYPLAYGSTFFEEFKRLLPSPIAVPLFGPPKTTATLRYRDMIRLHDTKQGVGYSLPAEGLMNFGAIGMLAVCLVIGILIARSFTYGFGHADQGLTYLYFIVVANLPFGLRSDALGISKGILYGLFAVMIAVRLSVRKERTAARYQRDRTSTRPKTSGTVAVAPTRRRRSGLGAPLPPIRKA